MKRPGSTSFWGADTQGAMTPGSAFLSQRDILGPDGRAVARKDVAMEFQTIRLDRDGALLVVTLDRPDVRNALNGQMRAELLHVFRQELGAARVVVLTGAGTAFCSGQDLGDAANASEIDLERVLRDEYAPLVRAIHGCPVPVITAVNGAAAGAGANLALSADVTIAAESAQFLQAFTRVGLIPDAGGTYWLPRQIGLARAMGAALFAEPIGARQAAEWGLIWEAVPDTAFDERWRERALALADGPTRAFKNLRQAMRAGFDNSLEDQLALEARLQGDCGRTRDFREGIVAFAERRPARFEGR